MRMSAFLLTGFWLAACGPAKEKEPNEDEATATAVKPGKVQGTLAHPRDVDVYRLVARQEGVFSAHVGGIRGADFVLSVRGPDRGELKLYDETSVGGDEQALDIGLKPGAYAIVLSNKNEKAESGAQAYTLEIKLSQGPGREREPNETPQSATPLELPGVTRGHFFPARNLLAGDTDYAEVDWYRLEIAQSGLFLLNIDLSEVPKLDSTIEIYDTNAYKLKEADSGGIGAGESLKSFGVRGPASYFMRLRSKHANAGNALVPYEVLTELLPYQGKFEFEPNDQRQDATPLEAESLSATIAPEGDADWYKVVVGEGRQILRAGVAGPEGLDLELKLLDALGLPLLTVDNMGKGQPEVLTGLGVTQGEYYLVVSDKSGRKADPRQAYTLTKSLVPFQSGLEYELNDSTASMQPLRVGESVDGYIAPKGDADFYEFNVYQKARVIFELAGVLNLKLVATLYDQEFAELEARSAAKAGESLAFDRELEPGTYALRLRAAEPGQNNVRDKYSLRLKAR